MLSLRISTRDGAAGDAARRVAKRDEMTLERTPSGARTCRAFGAPRKFGLAVAFALAASGAAAAGPTPAPRAHAKPTPRSTAHPLARRPTARLPVATALPAGVLARRPHDPPKIVAIASSPVVPGRSFAAVVRTTSNVASVEVRIDGFSQSLPRLGVGRFRFAYDVPRYLPPMLRRGYTVQFIARNVDGARDERDMPLVLR